MATRKVSKRKKAPAAATQSAYITAQIGRFDGEQKVYALTRGESVAALLAKAGISLSSGEEVLDENTNKVTLTQAVEEGNVFYVVGKYKSGQ